MAWVICWTWRPGPGRHAPTQAAVAPLSDQPPARLPLAVRAALLQRTLAEAARPTPRLLDLKV